MNRLMLLLFLGAPLAWRTLLEVGISSFQSGDTINLKRDCTWNETLTPPSSGTDPATGGALIKIDSYGNLQPPHLTGYLPVAAQWWTRVGTSNVWTAALYSATNGQSGVVQCGVRGFYCLTQAPVQLQYVRFGANCGSAQGSEASLSRDRDYWYDPTNYVLCVYSGTWNPATHYGTVAPIVLSGGTLLNLNAVSWLEKNDLRRTVYDRIVIAGDHVCTSVAISGMMAWRSYLGMK